jgi:hypothetical protein
MHDDAFDPMQQFERAFVSGQWLHRLTPTPAENLRLRRRRAQTRLQSL